jgi:hypothetical protein
MEIAFFCLFTVLFPLHHYEALKLYIELVLNTELVRRIWGNNRGSKGWALIKEEESRAQWTTWERKLLLHCFFLFHAHS